MQESDKIRPSAQRSQVSSIESIRAKTECHRYYQPAHQAKRSASLASLELRAEQGQALLPRADRCLGHGDAWSKRRCSWAHRPATTTMKSKSRFELTPWWLRAGIALSDAERAGTQRRLPLFTSGRVDISRFSPSIFDFRGDKSALMVAEIGFWLARWTDAC